MKRLINTETYIVLSFSLLALMVWWPTRFLPYHWDGAEFFVNSAQHFYAQGFWPLVANYSEFAHPPLLQAVVALSWKIFGQSNLVTHTVFWVFLPILLYATYRIGRKLSGSSHIGYLAAAAVGLTPFVLSEYGMTYIDLPGSALAVMGLAMSLDHHFVRAVVFFSAAVMIKFTVLPLVLVAGIIWYMESKNDDKLIKSIFLITIPGVLVALYLMYHYLVTDWWLVIPGRASAIPESLTTLINSIRFVLYVLFWRQQRWITVVSFGIAVFVQIFRRRITDISRLFWYFLWSTVATVLVFAMTGEFAPRYAIYILPLWYSVALTLINQAVGQLSKFYMISLFVIISFMFSLHPKQPATANFEFRNNEDLSYLDHIKVAQDAAVWLSQKYPEAVIYGGFPQSYQLTQSHQGYVSQPLHLVKCEQFKQNNSADQLIYLYPYHYTSIACDEVLRNNQVSLLRKFSSGRIWAAIYKIVP